MVMMPPDAMREKHYRYEDYAQVNRRPKMRDTTIESLSNTSLLINTHDIVLTIINIGTEKGYTSFVCCVD